MRAVKALVRLVGGSAYSSEPSLIAYVIHVLAHLSDFKVTAKLHMSKGIREKSSKFVD